MWNWRLDTTTSGTQLTSHLPFTNSYIFRAFTTFCINTYTHIHARRTAANDNNTDDAVRHQMGPMRFARSICSSLSPNETAFSLASIWLCVHSGRSRTYTKRRSQTKQPHISGTCPAHKWRAREREGEKRSFRFRWLLLPLIYIEW